MSSTKSKSAAPVKLTEAKTLLKAVAELKKAYAVSEKTGKLSTKQIAALPVWAAKETVSKTVSKSLLSLKKKADAIKAEEAKEDKASTPAKKEKKVAAVEKKLKDAAKKFGATLEKKAKALEKKIKKIEDSIQKKKEKALAKKAKALAKKAKKSASSKKSPNAKKARKSKKAVDSFATPMSFWGGNSSPASFYDDENM